MSILLIFNIHGVEKQYSKQRWLYLSGLTICEFINQLKVIYSSTTYTETATGGVL